MAGSESLRVSGGLLGAPLVFARSENETPPRDAFSFSFALPASGAPLAALSRLCHARSASWLASLVKSFERSKSLFEGREELLELRCVLCVSFCRLWSEDT